MKVTYHWLKDFVDITLKPAQLADKLTMAGIEVKSIETKYGDFIFEIEITSNRPDWLSVAGIAREVAAITGKKLKPHTRKLKYLSEKAKADSGFSLEIEDRKDCPVYTAKIIHGVAVGKAPEWMKKRLELVGCRSINNIVDTTNYVLFEHGEPLHAFDLDMLEGNKIVVRRAKAGEKLVTLDGTERMLTKDILVIADAHKPVALAGIMGGKDTEVTERTKNVLLEAAIFNPLLIRRGRQALGLQTEASYRFERSIDEEAVDPASQKCAVLIQECAGGTVVAAKAAGSRESKKKNIALDVARACEVLGVRIPTPRVKAILQSLGFKVSSGRKNILNIASLSSRKDVFSEVDLIEEVARIFGYENIPVSVPAIKPYIAGRTERDMVGFLKNMLVGLGLNEVITYSLVEQTPLQKIGLCNAEAISIANPLSLEQEILRLTLIPSLLKVVSLNLNQQQEYVGIFEIAKGFSAAQEGKAPQEELLLGIALSGEKSRLLEQGAVKDKAGVLHLKGILEAVCKRLGIKECACAAQGPGSSIALKLKDVTIGTIANVGTHILESLDIKNRGVVVAEVALSKVFAAAALDKTFVPMAVYPAVSRDISVVIHEDVCVEDVLNTIRKRSSSLLRSIKVIDYYKGAQIPSGCKGLTLSCVYRGDERTLTEAEVNALQAIVRATLTDGFQATLR